MPVLLPQWGWAAVWLLMICWWMGGWAGHNQWNKQLMMTEGSGQSVSRRVHQVVTGPRGCGVDDSVILTTSLPACKTRYISETANKSV